MRSQHGKRVSRATREGRYINVQILEELEAITVSYDYVRCVKMLKCSVVGGTESVLKGGRGTTKKQMRFKVDL